MKPYRRFHPWICALIASLTLFASLATLRADPPEEVVKDRKAYLPNRKHVEVPGKIIGVLVFDGQPVLSTEGRSGPADQLVFSEGGNSYRWVYVPTFEPNPMITNLQVPVGPKGEINIYPSLNMASPKTVAGMGVKELYTLVEVTVNHEKGSPVNDSFVGSAFKVVEGSKEYPLKVGEAIKAVRKQYTDYQKNNEKAFEDALMAVQRRAIKDKKPSGPREKQELLYVTWLGKEELLEVRFRTTVKDGDYTFIEGGGGVRPIDPLPPFKKRPLPLPEKPGIPPMIDGAAAFPPPPPRDIKIKVGTGFGIEYGRAYQVDKNGNVVKVLTLPVEDFVQEERAVPGLRDRPPFPLPPRPEAPNPFFRD